ncbi:branched-chain amino acid ABC transporter substrate-binding protein [Herbaspirillum sp. RTI4]|uniref:branched-chain amino acid ABC transporter substrate-binding protein n=1 Tax=Herbaspirillum sp. RTI4 TaxID=3048640 RepID=UPI002AB4D4F3|nr:branched-chain amino acid ABC transporter substrate-binding protein [Herbaspirillum sp. RTI4]MDY7577137.1 branched-chain amino acid ABC transporter substrate-binding protein [Herbaspirillum sp. RTI4]MEA9980427.1 branched-chain amino acid ABC transporter substrate-binding protein [Herbaspirillum sp. RTI4]
MTKHLGFMLVSALLPVLASAQEMQTVKIGFSSPLTGPQASAGKDNQGGVQLAIERLNAQGLVVGGKKVKFELLSEDDQADPRTGVSVAQKLVDQGIKAIVGPYNSGVTIPASRVYNEAGIVIATVASNPKITQQGFQYLYRVAASDSQLGGRMALYAAKELKLKKVAVIDDRTAYGQGLADEFVKVAKANGIDIVSRDFTNDKASDFSAILTSIKGRKPDGVFLGGYAPQGGPIKRQMVQLGIDVPLMGGDGICSPEMGRLGGDSIGERVYCTQGGALLDKLADGRRFAADYQTKFKRPAETYAASFYDGMMLIAKAMKAANSVEPKTYGPALAAIKYKGVSGNYEFDNKHDLKQSPVTIFRFKDSLPVPLTSY